MIFQNIPPQDIIDLNIFPVATGMEEHRLNAWISLEEPSGSRKFTARTHQRWGE
jgi:cobalamin-dependent methionine synthase I